MKSCCENKSEELPHLRGKQARVLKAVLFINASMFIVEFSSGWLAHSTSLLADSLDMFGDAVVYGFSLYALDRGLRWKAKAGLLKGIIMALFGAGVLFEALRKFITGVLPDGHTMGIIGFVALAANAVCLYLLYSHRADDINMRSTWICSRNDIIANLGVLLASGLVVATQTPIPDIAVGVTIAGLFLSSAYSVIRESLAKMTETAVS